MRPETRKKQIVDLLVEDGTVTLDALAQRFAVSKMTIHRDLDDLEGEGLLRKIRGGATIESSGQFESDYRYRARIAADEKRRIAARAAEFVEPGMSVMVDDGSTSQALAEFLPERRPITVITNNLPLIAALADKGGITLIALGGNYSPKFNGFFGVLAEEALAGLRADLGLLTSSAIDGRTAYHQDQEVLQVKRRMLEAASRSYLMVDRQKFGRTALHKLADLSAYAGVVTAASLDPEIAAALRRDGIGLHCSGEARA